MKVKISRGNIFYDFMEETYITLKRMEEVNYSWLEKSYDL